MKKQNNAMTILERGQRRLAETGRILGLNKPVDGIRGRGARAIAWVITDWSPVTCDLYFNGRKIEARDEKGEYCSQWVLREDGKIIGRFDYLAEAYAPLRAGRI